MKWNIDSTFGSRMSHLEIKSQKKRGGLFALVSSLAAMMSRGMSLQRAVASAPHSSWSESFSSYNSQNNGKENSRWIHAD
jgi:hypothetical protein